MTASNVVGYTSPCSKGIRGDLRPCRVFFPKGRRLLYHKGTFESALSMLDKKSLSERDICTKFITPAILKAGWDLGTQFLEEVSFTDGKIYVRGKLHSRGQAKRADYILYYKPNIPIAIVEAKDNKHTLGAGLQQALGLFPHT